MNTTPLDPHEEVTLRDGSRHPRVLVTVLMMSLRSLYERASNPTPEAPFEAMNNLLALYDLAEICKGTAREYTGECTGCFGKNRDILLKLSLVNGGERGPLTVRDEVRHIVNCALSFDMAKMSVRLQSPLA